MAKETSALRFYTVDSQYLQYLHENAAATLPEQETYLGVVLMMHNYKYFTPVSFPLTLHWEQMLPVVPGYYSRVKPATLDDADLKQVIETAFTNCNAERDKLRSTAMITYRANHEYLKKLENAAAALVAQNKAAAKASIQAKYHPFAGKKQQKLKTCKMNAHYKREKINLLDAEID